MAAPLRPARALAAAAKRRVAASSVSSVASGYERSLRPCATGFSPFEHTIRPESDRS